MTAQTSPIPTLSGLGGIADAYDVILCDVWGVLHDGSKAHPGAGDALIRFRGLPGGRRPRRVVLVSNAPRPGDGVGRILDRFGVPREAYDAIVTSGDLTRALVAEQPGIRMYHLGPERDSGIFQGLDLALTGPETADLVLCTGLFDDRTETVEDYRDTLAVLRARAVPMICANPDLVVEFDGRLIPCAGLLAAAYEELGGAVVYAGKPHRPVYEAALARTGALDGLPPPEPARVLAVGDAIRTDVAGARGVGIASLFVARGIHAEELGLTAEHHRLGEIADWLSAQPVRPDAVIERLVW